MQMTRSESLVRNALAVIVVAFFLAPIVWLFINAFKPERVMFDLPPIWLGFETTRTHFSYALNQVQGLKYVRNSIATGGIIKSTRKK
jgi:N,N'-diacetylchitobiose transport system permease protein